MQDDRTFKLLCADCEQLCGKAEKAFAERIFFPRQADNGKEYVYDSWMSRFAACLVWRVVRVFQLVGHLPDGDFATAEAVWRDFLLGKRPNVDKYELHLLPFDGVTRVPAPGAVRALENVPANINRYALTTTAFDLIRGEKSAFVFVKLPSYILLGLVRSDGRRLLKGTRLAMRKGRIGPRNYTAPVALMNYIFEKAEQVARLLDSISPAQSAKVESAKWSDLDRLRNSESVRAMAMDIDLFGRDAFHQPDRRNTDEPSRKRR